MNVPPRMSPSMMEMSMMALLTIVPVNHGTNDVAAIDNFDVSMVQSTVYNLGASNYGPPKLTAPSTAPRTIRPTRESNIGTSNEKAPLMTPPTIGPPMLAPPSTLRSL